MQSSHLTCLLEIKFQMYLLDFFKLVQFSPEFQLIFWSTKLMYTEHSIQIWKTLVTHATDLEFAQITTYKYYVIYYSTNSQY